MEDRRYIALQLLHTPLSPRLSVLNGARSCVHPGRAYGRVSLDGDYSGWQSCQWLREDCEAAVECHFYGYADNDTELANIGVGLEDERYDTGCWQRGFGGELQETLRYLNKLGVL